MRYWHLIILCAASTFVFARSIPANTRPVALFSDHAVMQRDMPLPVWGMANPGEIVRVKFAGQKRDTRADTSA